MGSRRQITRDKARNRATITGTGSIPSGKTKTSQTNTRAAITEESPTGARRTSRRRMGSSTSRLSSTVKAPTKNKESGPTETMEVIKIKTSKEAIATSSNQFVCTNLII